MKKELLTIALVICSIFTMSGQEAKFTVQVSMDSVLLGNYIEVTFKAENLSNAKIEAPNFEGFRVISGPSYSTSMQVINGDMTQSASNTYRLEPEDVGQFYIMPAQVKSEDTMLETEPIEINVYHNPDGIVQRPAQNKADDFWFQWPDRSIEPKPKKKPKKKRKIYRL